MFTTTANATATTTATRTTPYFTFDHIKKQIIGSEYNFKKSGIDGTAQYDALMVAMERHPGYELSPVAPKIEKKTYKGLTFDLIMEHVYTCGDEITKEEFDEIVNRNEKFPFIKSWFVSHHKANFSIEKIQNEIKAAKLKEAQAKLKAKKADVRKVVKARVTKLVSVEAETPAVINF